MWPWEHVVVGYLAYSLFAHLYYRSSPGALETIAVVVASVLPDFIDKPLAWEFVVFESGYALGHSVFFAVPLCLVVGVLARQAGRARPGLAFAIGYLLHLPADVIPIYFRRGTLPIERILWPVRTTPPDSGVAGFREQFLTMVGTYRHQLVAGELSNVEWVGLGLVAVTVVLWLVDGAPVARELCTGSVRVVRQWAARVSS
ncbi:metal-dependent hydrolase [Natrialbaceae archaeon A-CW1-1]